MYATAEEWSQAEFGGVRLGDERRNKRLVAIGAAFKKNPQATIPQQMKSVAATKATYRFLDNKAMTFERIQEEHWKKTRAMAGTKDVVLLIQDTTIIDLTFRQVADVGEVGNGKGRGLVLHTTLAVTPSNGAVLGVMNQYIHRRQRTHTKNEPSSKRVKRETEARFWRESVEAIGMAPLDSRWVYVADRGADVFDFYGACRAHNADLLVRIAQDRRRLDSEGNPGHVIRFLRAQGSLHQMQVPVTDKSKSPRQATVELTYAAVTLRPPVHPRAHDPGPQQVYGIRVWETDPPEDAEPLEWLLVTSMPINAIPDAVRYVQWYARRPTIEDYHQCLKTGCRLQERQLHTADRFERLLGIVGVVALSLLQLRDAARHTAEDNPASTILDPDFVTVIALHLKLSPDQLTARQAWLWIALQGGHLNRKHDPPPGWKALWHGWQHLQSLVEGFRLARDHPLNDLSIFCG